MIVYLAGRKYPAKSAGEANPQDTEKNLFHKYGLTARLQTFYFRDTLDGYVQFRAEEDK